MDYMAFHSLRRSGEEWTWKFDPEVSRQNDAEPGWHEMGKRLVAVPGRKAIVYGAESLLFTPGSADYVRELGGTDIPIVAVPEARHHLMLDQPLAFVTALRTIVEIWQTNDNMRPAT
jgi:pimeloyl-ACP methyl ester carboxylesterase